MSKAVTNEEVEDVLSSIRRLVSEDKRPLAGLSSAPRPPRAAEEPVHDRLVLTPALRVADAPTAPVDEGPLDLGSVARETWTPPETDSDVEDAATAADTPSNSIKALVQESLDTQDLSDDETGLTDGDYSDEGYWEDDISEVDAEDEPVADAVLSNDSSTLKQAAVEYGDATPDLDLSRDHFGEDTSWEDDAAREEEQWDVSPAPEEDFKAAKADSFDIESANEIELSDDAPRADEPEPQDASLLKADVPLTAKIAALGAAIGKSPQEWEPDGDEASDLSAHNTPAMAWEDDVELDAKGAPLRSAAVDEIDDAQEVARDETDKDPVAAAFGGDDQLMDEEALRELVAEIVRTELQGALGERITRNVRKLVRREIHRALTAQELE